MPPVQIVKLNALSDNCHIWSPIIWDDDDDDGDDDDDDVNGDNDDDDDDFDTNDYLQVHHQPPRPEAGLCYLALWGAGDFINDHNDALYDNDVDDDTEANDDHEDNYCAGTSRSWWFWSWSLRSVMRWIAKYIWKWQPCMKTKLPRPNPDALGPRPLPPVLLMLLFCHTQVCYLSLGWWVGGYVNRSGQVGR